MSFCTLKIFQEELSTEDKAVLKIPHLTTTATSTTNTRNTSASASITIDINVTRAEFEACIAPITELVEATVFHTVQQWQTQSLAPAQGASLSTITIPTRTAANTKESLSGTGQKGEKVDILAEEEDTDGFVQIRSLSSDAVDAAVPSLVKSTVPMEGTALPSPTATPTAANATATAAADITAQQTCAIDEIVLVGGSSRVPAVRAAIRQAFGKLGIQRFACDGPGELCTSLNPEEVVAEGLAIRGAVLSGVSTGKLRDLLMMDCLANSIGVMSWESSGGSNGCENVRVFDAVLTKGMPLPASNMMRFALADRHQKFVSLDIYEEVEECKIKSTKPDSSQRAEGVSPTENNAGVGFEMVYTYHVIATADVSIPADLLPTADGKGRCVENRLLFDGMRSAKTAKINGTGAAPGSVDVKFTMNSEGVLKFEVTRAYDEPPDSLAAKERQFALEHQHRRTHVQTTGMLIVYAVLMLAMYLFVKMTLTEVEVTPETPVHSPAADADSVASAIFSSAGTRSATSDVVTAGEVMVQAVAEAV